MILILGIAISQYYGALPIKNDCVTKSDCFPLP
jgi:hypothetical protein